MKKNMYSLMLAEQVIDGIDRLAREEGTNRSNLVNQILAEYLSLVTPEKRIDDIFRTIEALMRPNDAFASFLEPHANTMSIKSSLEYKYRPTIRYEVEMYRTPACTIGELKVNFRTQSPELLAELTRFFKLWMRLEELYVLQCFPQPIRYTLDEGRFTRSFSLPKERDYAPDETGRAIEIYIENFDALMKGWLGGRFREVRELENEYLRRLSDSAVI